MIKLQFYKKTNHGNINLVSYGACGRGSVLMQSLDTEKHSPPAFGNIRFPRNHHAFQGYQHVQGRDFLFRFNKENVMLFLEFFGGKENVEFDDFLNEQWQKWQNEENVANKTESMKSVDQSEIEKQDDVGYVYKRQPMDHQRRALVISRDKENFGLFMEQGTGKTKVVIDTAFYLYQKSKIDMLVIIAWPNGVHRNWIENELPQDAPEHYRAEFWSQKHKTKKKQSSFDYVLKSTGCLKIMSFNVEAFQSSKIAKEFIIDRCLDNNRCMVVIDQSACIKTPTGSRSHFILNKLSKHPNALYKRILDGQPVAEGTDELFCQFKFLDENIIGYDTITGFRSKYCDRNKFGGVSSYKNQSELKRKIDPYCFRVRADECLDLPDRIYMKRGFDLSDREQVIYNDLRKKNLAYFADDKDEAKGVLEENLAIVKLTRLQQIACGWFPNPDDFKPIDDKQSRMLALLSLIDEIEGKAIIFSRFKADLHLIEQQLKNQSVSYHGDIGEEERANAIDRFMNDDSVRFFIGQPRSAGIGLTLTSASHVIFYNNDYSLRFREESEKRAHRKGLEKTLGKNKSLLIWDLVANNTLDDQIAQTLIQKKELANLILGDDTNNFLEWE